MGLSEGQGRPADSQGARDSRFGVFIVGLVREGSLIVFELGICLIFIRNRIGDTATYRFLSNCNQITSSPRQESLLIWPHFFQYNRYVSCAKERVGHACRRTQMTVTGRPVFENYPPSPQGWLFRGGQKMQIPGGGGGLLQQLNKHRPKMRCFFSAKIVSLDSREQREIPPEIFDQRDQPTTAPRPLDCDMWRAAGTTVR